MEELKKNIWRIWKIGKLIKKTRKKTYLKTESVRNHLWKQNKDEEVGVCGHKVAMQNPNGIMRVLVCIWNPQWPESLSLSEMQVPLWAMRSMLGPLGWKCRPSSKWWEQTWRFCLYRTGPKRWHRDPEWWARPLSTERRRASRSCRRKCLERDHPWFPSSRSSW